MRTVRRSRRFVPCARLAIPLARTVYSHRIKEQLQPWQVPALRLVELVDQLEHAVEWVFWLLIVAGALHLFEAEEGIPLEQLHPLLLARVCDDPQFFPRGHGKRVDEPKVVRHLEVL